MSKARTWLGRGAVVAAALASIATQRPKWTLEPAWPAGAPRATPSGSHGLLLSITSTAQPTVECALAGSDYTLEPLPGATGRYLCPPGGTITRVALSGHAGGGCGKPEPPSDQTIRIDRVDVVETWSIMVATQARTVDDGFSRSGWVHTASPYKPFATAAFASGSSARAPTAWVYGRDIRIDVDRPDAADVDVHATIYGPCEAQPCSPPGDATLELR
jgi:hypothetical protein